MEEYHRAYHYFLFYYIGKGLLAANLLLLYKSIPFDKSR